MKILRIVRRLGHLIIILAQEFISSLLPYLHMYPFHFQSFKFFLKQKFRKILNISLKKFISGFPFSGRSQK
jgi:hypothetical protein